MMAPTTRPKIQTQGVHHITFMGADRQTSIDFWQGLLGMPVVFEQPNLDDPSQNHLYFDPGDGRLITVFTSESWKRDARPVPLKAGSLHHIAFTVSLATWRQVVGRLEARGIASSGEVDRGFMHSIYFRDPLGQLIELACYKFEPPAGHTHAAVLARAHAIRLAAGARNIEEVHLADAIEALTAAPGVAAPTQS
jgi:catechol 2,3-dioxygenase-like lactoylglutathione lyase family enzyme